ncbi:MAG: alpha/beta fold hydrolase [Firmicutes bacterium]|nr:alpha/beta fold hydrolase [Bacillota bacterium]
MPAVLLLHGFTGHKLESHRMFVKMARRLAQEGIIALRFDFRGSGDSAGDFADMTVANELSDAEAALAWLQARPEVDPARVGVLGLSLGGAVASLLASRHARELRAVALWSAVADLSLMARHAQADRRLSDGRVDLGGNVVGPAFFTDLSLHDLQAAAHRYSGPVLIVHGTADQSVPPEHARRYQAAFPGPKVLHWVDGADHTYNSFEWEQEVLQVTADWLRDRLA